ncbi:MAG: glycosyl transferase family 2 [Candidatus Saccharibacteria bacterium]|nr:glycosyl transferase family 2 [Candidatus Saccharibacteria bacterium]
MIVSVFNTIHFGMYVVGANIYDIMKFRTKEKLQKKPRGIRPLVTILIPAHNEEASIVRTLESLKKNSYRKSEIIVIDDASTDATKKLVREYIVANPTRNIRLMYKQKNVGKASALNHALRHGVNGSLVMTLDADSTLDKKSVANAVRYFDDPTIVGVAANVRVTEASSILGLLQKFEFMIGYRTKKFFTVSNSEFIIGGVASTYRMSTLKSVGFYDHDIITEDIALSIKIVATGNKKNKVVYGYDVVAKTEGVQTFKDLLKQRYRWKMGNLQSIIKHRHLFANRDGKYSKMLTMYRIPMAFIGEILLLFEPIVIGYVIYVCIVLGSLSLLVGSYITITLYLVWNIMPDEHMSFMDKIRMCAYAPIMYFIMYLMNVVQVVAVVRCLWNYKKVLRTTATSSTWQSPTRITATTSTL